MHKQRKKKTGEIRKKRIPPRVRKQLLLDAEARAPARPDEILLEKEGTAIMLNALTSLEPHTKNEKLERNREMMAYVWGLHDGVPRSLNEAGKKFGVSRETVDRVKRNTIKRMFRGPYRKRLIELRLVKE